jgi:hypothetical protein
VLLSTLPEPHESVPAKRAYASTQGHQVASNRLFRFKDDPRTFLPFAARLQPLLLWGGPTTLRAAGKSRLSPRKNQLSFASKTLSAYLGIISFGVHLPEVAVIDTVWTLRIARMLTFPLGELCQLTSRRRTDLQFIGRMNASPVHRHGRFRLKIAGSLQEPATPVSAPDLCATIGLDAVCDTGQGLHSPSHCVPADGGCKRTRFLRSRW